MAIRMVYDPGRSSPFARVTLLFLFCFQLIADHLPMHARAGVALGGAGRKQFCEFINHLESGLPVSCPL
jgi:hypothetical protein